MHWDCKRSGGRFGSLKADCTDFTTITTGGPKVGVSNERFTAKVKLKATSHSTICDIPMRLLREDQKHRHRFTFRATFHLMIFMRGQRATGKIQRNNYHHGNCGSSFTGKTSSVSLILTHRTHRNVKNR